MRRIDRTGRLRTCERRPRTWALFMDSPIGIAYCTCTRSERDPLSTRFSWWSSRSTFAEGLARFTVPGRTVGADLHRHRPVCGDLLIMPKRICSRAMRTSSGLEAYSASIQVHAAHPHVELVAFAGRLVGNQNSCQSSSSRRCRLHGKHRRSRFSTAVGRPLFLAACRRLQPSAV